MTSKPRKHHFVPQFWIRKFSDTGSKICAYDHQTGRISERSPRQMMQIFNLYTVQPSGADDTTLETLDLNLIDSNGSAIFNRVLNGKLGQSEREDLASFLAAQVLRDPAVVTSYNPRAQDLTLDLLSVFDAQDFDTFLQNWQTSFPGTFVTEGEFNYIRNLGLTGAEGELEKIITALDAAQGLPELPFTDVVRNPDGRDTIRDILLSCEWTLKTDSLGRFILGDTGVLYNSGDMDSLTVPLSCRAALYLTPSDKPSPTISSVVATAYDVKSTNLESAARSRRWIVGAQSELGQLKSQVGSNQLPDISK